MSVDEIVKLMLAVAVSFAIIGIAWQLMRVIGKLADSIQDLRRTFQNVSKVSDMAVEDYETIRGGIKNVLGIFTNFNEGFLLPLKAIWNLFSRFKGKGEESEMDATPTESEEEAA
jgi:hypothetical protein